MVDLFNNGENRLERLKLDIVGMVLNVIQAMQRHV
jgi:hypothetical protein